jgi:hypothetical protein
MPNTSRGRLLAAVTLLTGSIFPAMLWHAINNAAALILNGLRPSFPSESLRRLHRRGPSRRRPARGRADRQHQQRGRSDDLRVMRAYLEQQRL